MGDQVQLRIDMSSEVPLYQQLHDQIILGLATGKLQPGEALPSVRQLADELNINMLTVAKGYNLLKAEGYLISDRRRGTHVATTFQSDDVFMRTLQAQLHLLVAASKIRGLSEQTVKDLVIAQYCEFEGE
ncbi:GntR family transcriptional regulator [Loigolactobacillus coryniformis]|uniref:GntR family transcriptional regulator n=1 Tax=Loigolactobacillus coryniformis TaxID=1610 RepID=UPI0002196522|nr:GntR family transcriptional regulator [Loigolactobacillus coryniformis]KRK84189.1 GntR family transcriptional regulator [Loigolactobacillus coryniformis subsp. torquens DSM 20004 = KCTC 3535]